MRAHNSMNLILRIAAPLATCLWLTACTRVAASTGTPNDTVPVRVERAVLSDVPLEIMAVGNVEATQSVEVKSRVAGQIRRVAFREGETVARGQLLFSIDRDTLAQQAMEQQAELERDTALEQQARAVVARDAAAQKQSQSEADVAARLGSLGLISRQRVSQLITSGDTASAALHSDEAAIEAAAGASRADQARLGEIKLQLRYTDIVAPISGRAGMVASKAGNMVRDNDTTLVTLLQLTPIYVSFGIPEQRLAEVQRLNTSGKLKVEARVAAGYLEQGQLAFINNTVDPSTGMVMLKALFTNADLALWPGAFADVRLRLSIETARTVVPASAIEDGLDGKYVWLSRGSVASVAPVTVERTYKPQQGTERAIIASGIRPGDTIVTEGQLRLTPGARITVLSDSHSQN